MNPVRTNSLARIYVSTVVLSLIFAVVTRGFWGGDYSIHVVISLGYGLTGTTLNLLCNTHLPTLNKTIKMLFTSVLTIAIGTLHAWWWLSGFKSNISLEFLGQLLLISLFFLSVAYYFHSSRETALTLKAELQQAELQQSQQQKALVESQLRTLQSQIEPHFLFNTLANLKALIKTDPPLAEELLDNFSELLRSSLRKSRADKVSLADEVSSLKAYLAIQKIRLGDRLAFDILLNKPLDEFALLPPFLIQPLVENAVFHGIEPSPNGGQVTLSFDIVDQGWIICIIDNGVGLGMGTSPKGHGVALNNIRERLAALFPGNSALTIKSNAAGGVTATLEFPCEQ